MDKKLRIDELVEKLNAASNAYYGAGEEVLSNYEWDAMVLSRLWQCSTPLSWKARL